MGAVRIHQANDQTSAEVMAGRLRSEGIFDPLPVRQKWREHVEGKRNWAYLLWDVLMFQAWQDAQMPHGHDVLPAAHAAGINVIYADSHARYQVFDRASKSGGKSYDVDWWGDHSSEGWEEGCPPRCTKDPKVP